MTTLYYLLGRVGKDIYLICERDGVNGSHNVEILNKYELGKRLTDLSITILWHDIHVYNRAVRLEEQKLNKNVPYIDLYSDTCEIKYLSCVEIIDTHVYELTTIDALGFEEKVTLNEDTSQEFINELSRNISNVDIIPRDEANGIYNIDLGKDKYLIGILEDDIKMVVGIEGRRSLSAKDEVDAARAELCGASELVHGPGCSIILKLWNQYHNVNKSDDVVELDTRNFHNPISHRIVTKECSNKGDVPNHDYRLGILETNWITKLFRPLNLSEYEINMLLSKLNGYTTDERHKDTINDDICTLGLRVTTKTGKHAFIEFVVYKGKIVYETLISYGNIICRSDANTIRSNVIYEFKEYSKDYGRLLREGDKFFTDEMKFQLCRDEVIIPDIRSIPVATDIMNYFRDYFGALAFYSNKPGLIMSLHGDIIYCAKYMEVQLRHKSTRRVSKITKIVRRDSDTYELELENLRKRVTQASVEERKAFLDELRSE